MTTIFEYMGWCKHKFDYSDVPKCEYCGKYMMQVRMGLERENHPLDGNDMVAAINTMRERGDWFKFREYCHDKWIAENTPSDFIVYITSSPETFFKLMGEAIEKGVIGE